METHQFGGPWTVEKLDALRAYLNAYAQALKNQPFRRYYIDAFAGTGDRAVKRQEAASLLETRCYDEGIGSGRARNRAAIRSVHLYREAAEAVERAGTPQGRVSQLRN